MKVLIVFNHPAPYKVNLFNELAKTFDLTVIFERNANSDRNKDFYNNKIQFKAIFLKSIKLGNENAFTLGVKNHLKKNKYDLIIMNGYRNIPELIAIKYLNKHHIPYCLYINGGIIKRNEPKWLKNYKTKYISSASWYMSPDERSNEYLTYYGADASKIKNYPYSTIYEKDIRTQPFSNDQKVSKREEYGLNFKNLFVSTGQLIKRKNYLELIGYWKNQPSENGLIIIGEGKQKEYLENYIKENNLSNVKLLGYKSKSEIFDIYSFCNAFIFPSLEDIYGHVVNEALSQGLPVISLDNVNSSLHLIENKKNGFVVSNINSKNFEDAINYVLSHDMFDEAIKIAKENTIEKMVKRHIEIFEEIK